jgi:hypothetical protein
MRYRELYESVDNQRTLESLPSYAEMLDSKEFHFPQTGVTSLYGSPQEVDEFIACDNKLTTLQYGPRYVTGMFNCSDNRLESFEYGPTEVEMFFCKGNPIKTLKGSPQLVHGTFLIADTENTLQSYEGAPTIIGLRCRIPVIGNGSLSGLNKFFPEIGEKLTLIPKPGQKVTNILSVFMIKGLKRLSIDTDKEEYDEVNDILNRALAVGGRKGMMLAQAELVQNGYEDLAQL